VIQTLYCIVVSTDLHNLFSLVPNMGLSVVGGKLMLPADGIAQFHWSSACNRVNNI
jgi:hypothetical protein